MQEWQRLDQSSGRVAEVRSIQMEERTVKMVDRGQSKWQIDRASGKHKELTERATAGLYHPTEVNSNVRFDY